jgi:quinoprotein glucose dehydrogenase
MRAARRACGLALALASGAAPPSHPPAFGAAQPQPQPQASAAFTDDAWDAADLAARRFTLPPDLKLSLFAVEPHLANPVAFCFDEQGRCYVAETHRHSAGVGDIRGIMSWLDEELAARSVDDRLAYMRRRLGDKIADYTRYSERVKLLVDRDGDGRADHSTVFADGFNGILDGIGAGVLAWRGQVWYACVPDLWWLRDSDHDGVADTRRSLQHGYGIRVGFLGHDLHGLRFGPDGKLYFTNGDRGASIRTARGDVAVIDTGCVLRCNPDGSDLEVYATGLRNPQELVFDEFGNLWTGDNNSDSGDRARWVHVVEGGDSGWRVGYQFLEAPYARGPFNAEKLWYPRFPGQAAYIVPPVTNLAAGPSGLTYYPGTGLNSNYSGHFFLADFHGSVGSYVHAFKVRAQGASFAVVDARPLIKGPLVTDVDFGPDGALYVSDWVQGWAKTGKGRIYRLYDPATAGSSLTLQTRRLIAAGMLHRSPTELANLLAHPDQRVRQEAQFTLAERGPNSLKILARLARSAATPVTRLHAVWGLGQLHAANARTATRPLPPAEILSPLLALMRDSNADVRVQSAKVLGDAAWPQAYEGLVALTTDANARVRAQAAQSLGKLGRSEAITALLSMLRADPGQDPYLRHAVVMALTRLQDLPALRTASEDASPAVRMAALLTLRRLRRPEVERFLEDPDPTLVLEAARAINDEPIRGGQTALAALITRTQLPEPLARRVLNALFRQGTSDAANALAAFAARTDESDAMRTEALEALADWPQPSGRDRVTGAWQPLADRRTQQIPAAALNPIASRILDASPPAVAAACARTLARLSLLETAPALLRVFKDAARPSSLRLESLRALSRLDTPESQIAIDQAGQDADETVRKEGILLLARQRAQDTPARLSRILEAGSMAEKQSAFATLAQWQDPSADHLLTTWLDKLLASQVPAELCLDLLQAAAKRTAPAVLERLNTYQRRHDASDPLAAFRDALNGGNTENGHAIFRDRADVACVRCHKLNNVGGDVGPELAGIGARHSREYLLESIVLPNRVITSGYESVVVRLHNGTVHAGIVRTNTASELHLMSPEDGLVVVRKNDLAAQQRGLSAMPESIVENLSAFELRDLVEFLASLR